MSGPIRIAFVCVRNAGRSQMAAAFAERERANRGLEESIEILTGGTDPADTLHASVRDALAEVGIDRSSAAPREISPAELEEADYVATMGCATLDLELPTTDVRNWALPDPHGRDIEEVRQIREQVKDRVAELFEEIEARLAKT